MRNVFAARWIKYAALIGSLILSGCAKYRTSPLPTAPDLTKTPDLTAPASQFLLPGLPPHPVPRNGLDEVTVMTLAVFNNPDLKAARLQSGVASAQLLQAGLLPDPLLSAGYASSVLNYGGFVGMSEDIRTLILRGAAKSAASEHKRQVNLNILWQEWQVAERARELFIQLQADAQVNDLLIATRDLLADRYRRDQAAMRQGDVTSSAVSADLTVLADADASLRQLQLESNLARHQLNQLLGLESDVRLHLIGPDETAHLSHAQFQAAVISLPHRRVDLLALQAGYKSQEQITREAILAQFPSLSAGVEEERDPVEGVNSFGPNVSLTLPIFNRNRGQIAVQRATRAVLHQTYQAQLDMAVSQAGQVWEATIIMTKQLHQLNAQLPILEKTAAAAQQSFRQGNLDAGLYVSLRTSLLAKQIEAIRLCASLDNAQSALRTLLGLPFDPP
ncbi:MAG TPA: TolC family protein [Acidobacteriaceae bacterium]|nr:TolC family protein [Acidobacteriaceae bacterium]